MNDSTYLKLIWDDINIKGKPRKVKSLKNILKWREDIAGADRSQWMLMFSELLANPVAFISCRGRSIQADAAKGEMGSKGGGDRVRLSDVDTWELAGF